MEVGGGEVAEFGLRERGEGGPVCTFEIGVRAAGTDRGGIISEGHCDGQVVGVEGMVYLPLYGGGEVRRDERDVRRGGGRERVGGDRVVEYYQGTAVDDGCHGLAPGGRTITACPGEPGFAVRV